MPNSSNSCITYENLDQFQHSECYFQFYSSRVQFLIFNFIHKKTLVKYQWICCTMIFQLLNSKKKFKNGCWIPKYNSLMSWLTRLSKHGETFLVQRRETTHKKWAIPVHPTAQNFQCNSWMSKAKTFANCEFL